MSIAPQLRQFLDESQAAYDIVEHRPTRSAMETAKSCDIPAERLAKALEPYKLQPPGMGENLFLLGVRSNQHAGRAAEELEGPFKKAFTEFREALTAFSPATLMWILIQNTEGTHRPLVALARLGWTPENKNELWWAIRYIAGAEPIAQAVLDPAFDDFLKTTCGPKSLQRIPQLVTAFQDHQRQRPPP